MKKVLYCEEIQKIKMKKSQKIYIGVKAGIDFLIGLAGLAVCVLPFLLIGAAIKLDSRGPVFFVQPRIGKDGKMFQCIKFRTMSMDADHAVATYEYEGANDYITKVGKFLRKTSLDELPQLFNLLAGSMSFVGYRPSQNVEYKLMNAREQFGVYQARPGITGWAQINGRDVLAARPSEKAKYDAYYVQHISPWMDIKIIFLTVFKVLVHSDYIEGAAEREAILEGQVNK